ncbi:MAG: asparaginase [Firmicutes bacterium]|jgi:L-asparaginase II|nr:asparaginase [Bacillota bacterium]
MSCPLVSVIRGDLVESVHRGDVAVVDAAGALLYSVGDPDYVTYWRSSAKPIQVLPIIASGAADRFGLTPRELAVMAASHGGEDFHIEAVASVLSKIGLSERDLKCGRHAPVNRAQAIRLIRERREATEIYNNCSGKHAGMLALAVHSGYSIEDYFKVDHPVQREMVRTVSEVCEMPEGQIALGIDGCGVTVFGMPIVAMARAYARLADPAFLPASLQSPAARVTQAMMSYPEMVAGTGEFTTRLIQTARGALFAKNGAEGVYCIGVPGRGMGIAVKIEDGNARAYRPVVMEILRQLGIGPWDAFEASGLLPACSISNARRETVGRMEACFELERRNRRAPENPRPSA